MVVEVPKVEIISVLNQSDVIHIGYNLIQDYIAQNIVSSINNVSNYIVITDSNLAPLYLENLISSLKHHLVHGQRLLVRTLACGEKSKCRQAKTDIEDYLLSESCTRDTCLVALGGGVVGDLVGYVASTFMRGIPYIQIPTTLLSMVDSSIGGKTAIDTPHGKNLIGTFWQPKRIYMDLSVLQTLPRREISNGMAEIIKTAAISNKHLFDELSRGKESIYAAISTTNCTDPDRQLLAKVICTTAKFKANVVTLDEREGGLRGLLNFGHSIGHALEAILSPLWLHGECVSIGMIMEARLACTLGHCTIEPIDKLIDCLKLYDLPTVLDIETSNKLELDQVMNIMKTDKKNKGAQKRIVLLSEIGNTVEKKASDVSNHEIENVLKPYLSKNRSEIPDDSTRLQQPSSICSPSINLISSSTGLDQLTTKLYEIIKNKFQCVFTTSIELDSIVQAQNNQVHIYFTTEPGSTRSAQDIWFEYVVTPNEMDYHFLNGAMTFITDTICNQEERHINPTSNVTTTFVTPTISDYKSVLPVVLNQWLELANAVEFRVDLLTPQKNSKDWIVNTGKQLAYLRQKTNLPVIFTVRTVPQAGNFDPTLVSLYFDLLYWGHRWGCDYVDIEISTLSSNQLDNIMSLGLFPTKVIASYHDPVHMNSWSSPGMKYVYDKADQLFRKHTHQGVIKIVGFANTFYDNIELELFRHNIDPTNTQPLILINMGPRGRFSRIANKFMSPATYPSLPSAAAPGQLSINQLLHIRDELCMD
ncbi:hypothetical protein HPULCUR_007206 [Helicostylum pulchrum]|uniref:3-dehydroquinate synthase n=1 Tax=Helicostylum pulchrum TaxID=562976 RepID=A0ABP9Y434_9FUNG